MMLYCIYKLGQRVLLFAFGISFFVFLLGRDGLEQLFLYESETKFPDNINNHAYISMICALFGVWGAFSFSIKPYSKTNTPHNLTLKKQVFNNYIKKYSKLCFFITYPFAIILNIAIAIFVIKFGYHSFYTDLSGIIAQSPILYVISKIELMMPASFAIFMSSLPSKSEFKKLSKPYVIYLIITLGCGQRSTFLLGLLLFFIFVVYMQEIRPNEKWFSSKTLKTIIISLPLIAIGGTFYNSLRFGKETSDISIYDGFCRFFYDQGVTSNIVKRAYEYEYKIPIQETAYTLEFLHSGLPARILGIEVYQGNNLDHAYKGGSFTHSLGYAIRGDAYLAGGGTGSSYIAELYYDFGYLGVFLGSCIYGLIFSSITNFKKVGIFGRSLAFIIVTQLLWAPRASFSAFLSFIFAPSTIGLLILIFGGAYISTKKSINNQSIYE